MADVEGVELLAQNYFGNTRPGSLAGPVGAFFVAVLAVATVLLIRNMNARLRRLPARFSDDDVASSEQMSDNSDSE